MYHYLLKFFPVLILIVGLGVGYGLSRLSTAPSQPTIEPLVPLATTTDSEAVGATTSLDEAGAPQPVTIDVRRLPEPQQRLLSSLGITDSITFSGEQIACAEAAIGKGRVLALVAGDTPGPAELTKLLGCR